MKVIVMGAGVVGVASAYYLAEAGHEVVLIDRQPGPALETSFANAGEISPGYASPWAAPGIPAKAIRWLFMRHAPLIIDPHLDMAMLRWTLAMLRNCTAARYALNKSRMVRLADFSRDELIALRGRLGLDYDQRSQGTLQLFRTQKQIDASAGDIAVLQHYGVPYEVLDRDGCIAAEPGLAASRDHFLGGLRLPQDETGDCHIFTNRLAAMLPAMGVDIRYGCAIEGLEKDGDRIAGNSHARFDYLSRVLPERAWTVAAARDLMATHSVPICQHAACEGDSETISSVVYSCRLGGMEIAEGTPCLGRWQVIAPCR